MIRVLGYASKGAHSALKPFEIERHEVRPQDVQMDVLYCGVCHSDIHQVKNEWKNTIYPCMPGHEIVGKVTKVGAHVSKFKVGDLVGVGCMVDSCRQCPSCKAGFENYCDEGFLGTYNGNMREPKKENHTYGGYSSQMIVREEFVLRIPPSLKVSAVAPILCAGVTTFSPLRHWNVKQGTQVGVVGLGGIGHMAVKLAVAMGADVTVISTTVEKKADAMKLGAKRFVVWKEKGQMKENEKTLDLILNTIPQPHDANVFVELLKRDGTQVIVGCIAPLKEPMDVSKMITDRRSLATTLIGSVRETQDVLDFCAQHEIVPDVKLIPMDQINDIYKGIDKQMPDYRYVIDMSTLKNA